ncbi:Protein of unknown function [Gryllus bimaculatus]|nr:Protein of unknown function [Gryllus bimaculatus]
MRCVRLASGQRNSLISGIPSRRVAVAECGECDRELLLLLLLPPPVRRPTTTPTVAAAARHLDSGDQPLGYTGQLGTGHSGCPKRPRETDKGRSIGRKLRRKSIGEGLQKYGGKFASCELSAKRFLGQKRKSWSRNAVEEKNKTGDEVAGGAADVLPGDGGGAARRQVIKHSRANARRGVVLGGGDGGAGNSNGGDARGRLRARIDNFLRLRRSRRHERTSITVRLGLVTSSNMSDRLQQMVSSSEN